MCRYALPERGTHDVERRDLAASELSDVGALQQAYGSASSRRSAASVASTSRPGRRVHLPRTSAGRITAAIRFDVGISSRAEFSGVPDAGAVVMITANVGFLLGGPETGSSDH